MCRKVNHNKKWSGDINKRGVSEVRLSVKKRSLYTKVEIPYGCYYRGQIMFIYLVSLQQLWGLNKAYVSLCVRGIKVCVFYGNHILHKFWCQRSRQRVLYAVVINRFFNIAQSSIQLSFKFQNRDIILFDSVNLKILFDYNDYNDAFALQQVWADTKTFVLVEDLLTTSF